VFASWCVGVLACWRVGVLACWRVGVLACWRVGMLASWRDGVLACWRVGVLACWRNGCTVVVDDDDVLMLRCAVLSRHDDLLNPQPNPQNHSPYCDGGSVCSSSNLASLNLNPPIEPCVCVYMTLLQAKQCADKEHYIRGVPWFAGKCPIHG
jgi:hypothetical protein